jgi:hypothetical protein
MLHYKLPYELPKDDRTYADYYWDKDYPGTMAPGMRKEGMPLEEVLEYWEGRENGAVDIYPRDERIDLPIRPPEDIVDWLHRIGLIQEPEEDEDLPGVNLNKDSLLSDEFDLDDVAADSSGLGDMGGDGMDEDFDA